MQDSNQEIIFVIAVGGIIGLLLVGFIISTLYFYQRRQKRQEKEITDLKEQYQKELLSSQLEMQENTMKQIGQELHDNIKQQLVVVNSSLRYLPIERDDPNYEIIKENQLEIDNIIKDISEVCNSLHTDRVFHIGLLESIDAEVRRLGKIKTLTINYNRKALSNYFDGQTSTFIFRMLQEMLQNILKHAKASEINIEVFDRDAAFFEIRIQDNGVGFDVKANMKQSKETGIGLTNMFNRARLIGAKINIESEIGKGTTVSLVLPIPEE
jgi:signal transduction histidine kinase